VRVDHGAKKSHQEMGTRRKKSASDRDDAKKRCDGDAHDKRKDADALRRSLARRERSKRKHLAMKEEVRMQDEARRIQKRAQVRLRMLEQAASVESCGDLVPAADDGSATRRRAGAGSAVSYLEDSQQLRNDILDQPASISWKLRLLYRVGRTFKDAAAGLDYCGYRIRFVLKDSIMLRAVLAGFETLIREQYLHVRRSRLANHLCSSSSSSSPPSDAATCKTVFAQQPYEVPCIRAISVVVECDSVLDIDNQVMWCKVMRARQDKLDPNCFLTITRTLNVMRDPVDAESLIEALCDADKQPQPA